MRIRAKRMRGNGRWWGRWGGGWDWKLGVAIGGRTVLLELLWWQVRIERGPERRT